MKRIGMVLGAIAFAGALASSWSLAETTTRKQAPATSTGSGCEKTCVDGYNACVAANKKEAAGDGVIYSGCETDRDKCLAGCSSPTR